MFSLNNELNSYSYLFCCYASSVCMELTKIYATFMYGCRFEIQIQNFVANGNFISTQYTTLKKELELATHCGMWNVDISVAAQADAVFALQFLVQPGCLLFLFYMKHTKLFRTQHLRIEIINKSLQQITNVPTSQLLPTT